MASNYAVLVAGNGETSRANLDALMDDHYYAYGPNGVLVLPIIDRPTQAQIWAAQLAAQRGKNILVYGGSGVNLTGIPSPTLVESTDPIKDALAGTAGLDAQVFLLWNVLDPICSEVMDEATALGIPAYDLCNGLVLLDSVGHVPAKFSNVPPEAVEDTPVVDQNPAPEWDPSLLKGVPVLTPSVIDDMRLQQAVNTIIEIIVERVKASL